MALPSNEKLANRFRVGVNYTNRIDAFTTSDWSLQYHNNWVHPTLISDENPNYFSGGGSRIKYFSLDYNLVHDQRILPIYPEGGHLYFLQIRKDGLGFLENGENFSVAIGGEKYFKPHPNIIWGGRLKMRYNLDRSAQGYFNYTALGYGDNIKGYELYVIDGKDYALLKTAWRFRLIQKNIHLGKLMPFKRMRTLPFLLFFRLSTEVAYVNDPFTQAGNPFANRALIGYGPAVDLMMYYNFSMSAEYNFNHLGQRGFYLNSSFSF